MTCDNNECRDGAKVQVVHCEKNPTRWRFLLRSTDKTFQIKVHNNDNDDDQNLCIEADDASANVRLKSCLSNDDEKQRFVSTPNGAFRNGPKFEITPLHKLDHCLAQDHHPRDGEEIFQQLSAFSRASTTSKWQRYNNG